jgi:hypothetical protein
MSTTYTAPIAAAVARLVQFARDAETACLDRCGTAEDALAEPKWKLCLAQKAVDGIVLVNSPTAIETIAKVQVEIARFLKVVDSVLPRTPTSRDLSMDEAAPKISPLLADVKPLLELVISLDPFVSPTGRMF